MSMHPHLITVSYNLLAHAVCSCVARVKHNQAWHLSRECLLHGHGGQLPDAGIASHMTINAKPDSKKR